MTDDEIKDEIDDLTEQLNALLATQPPQEPEAPVEVRAALRQRERMKNRVTAKAEHAPAPLNSDAIDNLLAESAALAEGGELHEAQVVARIALQIARAAKLTGKLDAPELTQALVHFDPGQSNFSDERATIQVTATAAKASFSKLIMHAMRGDRVIIERFGKRIARIVPYEEDEALPVGAIRLD